MSFLPETEYTGFGGYEFVIKGQWPYGWDPNCIEGPNVALDSGSDALIAHNAKIMEEYDCKIKPVLNETWDWPRYLYMDHLAGTVDYDLMDVELFRQIDNIKTGYLEPWNKYGLDMTDYDKYGPDVEYGSTISSYRSVNDRYVFMPSTPYNSEVAKFVDIWFEEYEELPHDDIMSSFKTYNFFNEESYDIYMNLSLNANFDYSFILYDVYDKFMGEVSTAVFESQSIVSAIDSYSNIVSSVIDENLNK